MSRSVAALRSAILALLALALLVAAPARAQDYTDIWYNPTESGWGVNVVQSGDFLFLTFFIYGQDGRPTWYTANLNWNGSLYTGPLYLTNGSWFAAPWNPSALTRVTAGSATFQPSTTNAYQATLSYTVTGLPPVVKAVERQPLTVPSFAGSYNGGQRGSWSLCANATNNGPYDDTFLLDVTQTASNAVELAFQYDLGGGTCRLSGALEARGQLFRIPGATYSCTGYELRSQQRIDFTTTATVYELKQTGQGIEGRFVATIPGTGCQESAAFSAVLR